ncbi:PGPGW domain-containing protein [Aeromicrobium sp. Leaf350]|uniref:PGPGW domain-containing protein n=1 Tax=Aeromicrobium sp. Leaf350 TaxID=2876565 RepID=UPI001E62C66B|nr:PGPGW domain-containing protein [Aeromicrobium sp. Leaf350]
MRHDLTPAGTTMSDGPRRSTHLARGVAITVLGWILVLAGVAAIFLPGPGLLLLVAGLAVLANRYEWAERRLEPVKVMAFKAAADGVQTWPRILGSVLGALLLGAVGVVWGLRPDAPDWWPIADRWWLIGGWGTGATLIVSALIALGFMVYSFRRFRGVPDYETAAEREARED